MAGVDEVLERLITDLGFRRRLREDPAAALAGYDLDEADLELLASQLDDGGGQAHGVERRTSKAALFGLLSPAVGGLPSSWGGAGSSVPEVTDEVQVGLEHDDRATPGGTNEIVLEDGRGREGTAADSRDLYANLEISMPFAGDDSG
jgi:hypothetical protein